MGTFTRTCQLLIALARASGDLFLFSNGRRNRLAPGPQGSLELADSRNLVACPLERELRLNPGLERAFQPLGFLVPVQDAPILPKNVVKSVFGSVSARRRAQNVAIRIVHTAIADLFCASQSGSLQIVHLPPDWTTGSLKRSPSNAQQ